MSDKTKKTGVKATLTDKKERTHQLNDSEGNTKRITNSEN
jgi:hypothetical protein